MCLLTVVCVALPAFANETAEIGPIAEEIIVPTPAPTPMPRREVSIRVSPDQKSYVVDTEVTLTAGLTNYLDSDVISVSWEYSEDGRSWHTVAGADSLSYTFRINESNYRYYWRVAVYRAE